MLHWHCVAKASVLQANPRADQHNPITACLTMELLDSSITFVLGPWTCPANVSAKTAEVSKNEAKRTLTANAIRCIQA